MNLKELNITYLHMNTGAGEFSYAQNTIIQRTTAYKVNSYVEKALQSLLSDEVIRRGDQVPMRVADLGCGSGPAASVLMSTIVESMQKICKELKWDDDEIPELQLHLNDLASNDFSVMFQDMTYLRQQYQKRGIVPSCFVTGVPGSFYDRLFSKNSLHLVHSNYSLQWLSQTPAGLYNEHGTRENRANICVNETSSPTETKAYHKQFQEDWISFLSCRFTELVPGGRIVVALRGWPSWEVKLLGQAIASLVSQGLIEGEKLDTFNIGNYYPSKDEIQEVVNREGSFEIEYIEAVVENIAQEIEDKHEKAQVIAKCIRAFTEPLVSHHFGEQVPTVLYEELTRICFEYWSRELPEGMIEEKMLDAFNLPLFSPSQQEIEEIVREERSFAMEHIETLKSNPTGEITDIQVRTNVIAKSLRSITDSIISHHFGEQIWDALQDELVRVLLKRFQKDPIIDFCAIVVLLRKVHSNN